MQVAEYVIIQLLRQHDINVTRNRIKLLSLMCSMPGTISTGIVLEASGFAFDRITIYRTMHEFRRKGLLESIPNTHGKMEFSLTVQMVTSHIKACVEANSVCTVCGREKVINIPESTGIENISGFLPRQIIVKGICDHCVIADRY